jgi:transcriptional regulator with XRE-family HTH domain
LSETSSTTIYGRWVRSHRDRRGWSQEELGRRAGLGLQAISNIESGRTTEPRLTSLRKIAKAFGVDVNELLAESPEGVANGAA